MSNRIHRNISRLWSYLASRHRRILSPAPHTDRHADKGWMHIQGCLSRSGRPQIPSGCSRTHSCGRCEESSFQASQADRHQKRTDLLTRSRHPAPCWQGWLAHSSMSREQSGPSNPGKHWQVYMPTRSLQVAPFLQGLDSHSSISLSQLTPGESRGLALLPPRQAVPPTLVCGEDSGSSSSPLAN